MSELHVTITHTLPIGPVPFQWRRRAGCLVQAGEFLLMEGGKEREAIPGRFDRSIPTAKRGGKKVKGNRNFCHWHEEDGGTNKLPFLCHITEGEYVFLFSVSLSSLLFTAGPAFLG